MSAVLSSIQTSIKICPSKRKILQAHWFFINIIYTVKPVLRGHHWNREQVAFQDRWPLKRGSIHMKCSMTGQEVGDLLIQVKIEGQTIQWTKT